MSAEATDRMAASEAGTVGSMREETAREATREADGIQKRDGSFAAVPRFARMTSGTEGTGSEAAGMARDGHGSGRWRLAGPRRGRLVRGCGVVRVVEDEGERQRVVAQLMMDQVLG